jgi:putative phage-type endonuclease
MRAHTILELEQGSAEWHKVRSRSIGASDAPVIMHKSPWLTPYKLWEQKLGLRKQNEINAAMARGNAMEQEARDCFTFKTRIPVAPKVMRHQEHEWMMASLDGIDPSYQTLVEIKCANKDDHALAKQGKVPEKYYYQLQHQLEVTGLDHMSYFSYDGTDGVIVEVGRNTRDINEMLGAEKVFYDYMVDILMPPMTGNDYIIQDSKEWRKCSEELLVVQDELNALDRREKDLRMKLIEISDGNSSIGSGVKLLKVIRKGNIQYNEVPELRGVNLEKYRADPVSFWKISKDKAL